jgi:flap endonuclease-1
LERAITHVEKAEFPVSPDRIREIFMSPNVTDKYHIEWKNPQIEQIIDFICGERDFSEERVRRTLERMAQGSMELKGKTTLEEWFK